MTPHASVRDVVDELAREPLRHIVLLKHLLAYPEHVKIHRACDPTGVATLVLLEASVSPYDRQAYPRAAVAAFVSSDRPGLTASLMSHVPRGVGIVFKLSRDADLAPVESEFAVKRRTAFVSFTSTGAFEEDAGVRITMAPSDATLQLFEAQGHGRSWLEPLLRSDRAFACALERGGDTLSACVAFENYGPVWEVGGVTTAPSHRGRGLGTRVVRTALAKLCERALIPRYQVEAHNEASIGLARSVGLKPFLTIAHYAHAC
jgi:ribosomal protein S18 acetylase RimI-like enzyme